MFRNDLVNRDDPRFSEAATKPGTRLGRAVAAYHGKTDMDLERFEDAAALFGTLATLQSIAHMVLAEKATHFFEHATSRDFVERELPKLLTRLYPALSKKGAAEEVRHDCREVLQIFARNPFAGHDGFIARILSTRTGGLACGAAAAITSTRARHSSIPVASRSRKDRTRESDQSIAAITGAGQAFSRALPRGYTGLPNPLISAKHSCTPRARVMASPHDAPPPRRWPATDTLSKGHAQRRVATQPPRHVGFEGRRQPGGVEHVYPALLVHEAFLAARADADVELAVAVEVGLHKRHPERATLHAHGVPQGLRLEGVEHELHAPGRAALQRRQHRRDLVGEHRDDDEIVGCLLVQRVGHPHLRALALDVDDAAVALELLEPHRAGPGDDGDIVVAGAGQLESKGAADLARPEDDDAQR